MSQARLYSVATTLLKAYSYWLSLLSKPKRNGLCNTILVRRKGKVGNQAQALQVKLGDPRKAFPRMPRRYCHSAAGVENTHVVDKRSWRLSQVDCANNTGFCHWLFHTYVLAVSRYGRLSHSPACVHLLPMLNARRRNISTKQTETKPAYPLGSCIFASCGSWLWKRTTSKSSYIHLFYTCMSLPQWSFKKNVWTSCKL